MSGDHVPVGIRSLGIAQRRLKIDFSIVSQMDGLLYAILGLRIERDVFASTLLESHCDFFGSRAFESCASFTGIYFTDFVPERLSSMVAMARKHRAVGVFVLPMWIDHDWYKECERAAMLQFRLPEDAVSCAVPGDACPTSCGVTAFVVSFGWIGRMKKKRRVEKVFDLAIIAELRVAPFRIGTVPRVLTRPSPLADEQCPSEEMDTLPDAGPFRATDSPTAPRQAKSMWNVPVIRRWATRYPFPEIAGLACQAVDKGVDSFVGRLDKSVVHTSAKELRPAAAAKCRAKMMEECAAELTHGPFKQCPWVYARICAIFDIPKNKHTPWDDEIRLISHFSKGGRDGAGSMNVLCYSPRLIGFHCRAKHLRDMIAQCGKGAMVYAVDVPKCFRRQRIPERLLRLFVYRILTEEFGGEFFVDASCPFGWATSEWKWQCILAILEWRLLTCITEHFANVLSYVDNFFDINRKMPQLVFDRRCAMFDGVFEQAGLVMHEQQKGTQFKGLGWEFDTEAMVMQCPEDKYLITCKYVAEWNAASVLSCQDWHKAAGILYWLTEGFRVCRAAVGYIIHDRTRAQALCDRLKLSRRKAMMAKSKQSSSALKVMAALLPRWDRRCPIVEGFTPTATWQFLGRVDASTDWGCGGMIVDASLAQLVGANHEWSAEERAVAFVSSRESTGVLEAMGALWWLQTFSTRCRGSRVLLELDNSAAVLGLQGVYSPTLALLSVIESIAILCCELHVELRVRHVHGDVFNRVADALSHNHVEQARRWATVEFGTPLSFQ